MWNTTTLSNRIMNSGENFLLAASPAVSRLSRPIPELACPPAAQIPCPLHQIAIWAPSKFRPQKDHRLREIHSAVISEPQRRFVQNSQQKLEWQSAGFGSELSLCKAG
jgi:hypothetical protein